LFFLEKALRDYTKLIGLQTMVPLYKVKKLKDEDGLIHSSMKKIFLSHPLEDNTNKAEKT